MTAPFDVHDRLHILNLINGYAYYYDNGMIEEFIAMFADKPQFIIDDGSNLVIDDKATLKQLVSDRLADIGQRGLKQRHMVANPFFISQSADRAEVSFNTTSNLLNDQGILKAVITSYRATFRKQEDGWRISQWRIKPEGLPPQEERVSDYLQAD